MTTIDNGHEADVQAPPLPPTRTVVVEGLGELNIRHVEGPDNAPTIALLHGWTATADINYFSAYDALSQHFSIISFDQRGHGTGLRSKKSFRLEDCADDVVRVADALEIQDLIGVGYSMGGTIAQLLWKQHPERVRGLVLCATAPYFSERREERLSFMGLNGLAALARLTPGQARDWFSEQFYLQRKSESWGPWAIAQAAQHDWRMVLEAGHAVGQFSSLEWAHTIDVPTSVIVTLDDPVVPKSRQVKLFDLIPDADVFRVKGEHDAIVAQADHFVPTLVRAIDSVDQRASAVS
ncbi:MAG: alpha/beta fold hydrolase [Ilumatobacteraceae bacterium]|nr:alpha/beta fold hydrolase [Actinomycetota bacterium]